MTCDSSNGSIAFVSRTSIAQAFFQSIESKLFRIIGSEISILNQLAALIPKLPLSSFTWAAKPRVPECILDALRRHADCRVHLQLRAEDFGDRSSGDITFPSIQTLKSVSGLRSIATHLMSLGVVVPAWDDASNENGILRLLGKLISESPLRSLQIHAAGRIYPRHEWSPHDDDDFTILTDFRWMTDSFDSARGPLRLRKLGLTNMCMCGPDQQTLLHLGEVQLGKCISWKHLRDVHFTCPTLLGVIASEDVQLQALTLRLDTSYLQVDKSCRREPDFDSIRSLLFSQFNLEYLELWNGLPVIASGDEETDKDLFSHLGRSLRSLTLHENEPGNLGPSPRSIISVMALRLLGEACPRLRDLAIDVPYKDAELLKYLHCVSRSLWFIRNLELLVELEKSNQSTFREPVSDQRCRQIWNDLRSSSSRLRLEKLTVSVGAIFSNERNNDSGSMTRWQRRFLVEEERASDEKTQAVVKRLELEEFEERLRHDLNATYGSRTHHTLLCFKDIAVKGSQTWIPPPRSDLLAQSMRSADGPPRQVLCVNEPPTTHPLFAFRPDFLFAAIPPPTQHYRQTRRRKPQGKLRSLLPKDGTS
ncbi:uncharacterized protein BDZ99DRAFT_523316 [Mytilinidion resinicola]|uniref:Uncharacterized protein n=1 Tax=Mytilinidion resinicola TaxID=574789 RepID=A0A6A6YFA9_9PEZI|nr:uncharacterized protein BDZ99DRAFT_523316 [Mytilinidion resinicola]KAF2806745.1 hypothetical protein BDZ99DRAFT_523316 [Mytilinidion resinicola]